MNHAAHPPIFEHTPVLTLDEAAHEAERRRAPLHVWRVIGRQLVEVFFHGECVIHLDVLGLEGLDAVTALLREPRRLYRVEFYRWPRQRTLLGTWTAMRAAAEGRLARTSSGTRDDDEVTTRLGVFGAQM